jgi:ergothioneine biosynthesis protein EgtB
MNDRLPLHSLRGAAEAAPPPLAARYRSIRSVSEALAEPLTAEDCAIQSMPDASPVKWHLGHTSWFFETFVLRPHLAGYAPFDPAFGFLFNSYYNAIGDRHPRPQRGLLSRPSLEAVRAYRAHVDAGMAALLGRDAPFALIELGLNHEQQHQELILTDVKHLLSCNPLKPAYRTWRDALDASRAAPPSWIEFEAGLVEIGHDGSDFAFDNEAPRHRVYLNPYALASHPVTNAEYAEFIADGGYRRPELWLSEGWDWVNTNAVAAPLYWEWNGAEARQFTLHGMLAVEPGAPVCHVSLFEADAYARWAQARLPTEAEWESAAAQTEIDGRFLEDGFRHPRPATRGGAQLAQLFGDVWEWTRSAYAPYPGFRPADGAIGEYNGKFMCNQYVLRGGSCATPRSHIRPTYRNFFPAAARWQFSGFRLARDL